VECGWNVTAHGDTREAKWRGNWRIEWVASTFHGTSEHGVSSITTITTADAHTSAASSQLNWRLLADLNGLVHFAERRNLVSALVPSHFKLSLIDNWRIKKPTRCHMIFYCTSYRLNMFWALLCPSSGAHDYDVVYHIVLEPATRTPLQPNCTSPPSYSKPTTKRPFC